MKLTILGYLGGFPSHNIGTSSYLLESADFSLLIDCGSGALINLEKLKDPLSLDAVILSHYHADHIADVGVLQYYWQLHPKHYKLKELPIYGNTEDMDNFKKLDWPKSTQKIGFSADDSLQIGPFEISFLKTHHPVPTFAMRIVETTTQKVLVFTADTGYFDQLVDFCKDADVLMTDTNFDNSNTSDVRWHMTADESAHLALDSHAKRLILTHLPDDQRLAKIKQEVAQVINDQIRVQLAQEGLQIDI